ncbi:hypothetical protein, partial [Actinoplanes sp. NPDC049599]|uniref:hypothetical protein n=1 Tax=Actinoplanes sp. NPDC049599 TaxID=3363903 RepID=UPI0037AD8098
RGSDDKPHPSPVNTASRPLAVDDGDEVIATCGRGSPGSPACVNLVAQRSAESFAWLVNRAMAIARRSDVGRAPTATDAQDFDLVELV